VFPPSMAYREFEAKKEYFETATGCRVAIEQVGKTGVLQVYTTKLQKQYNYEINPADLSGYELPLPLGYTLDGLFVVDLATLPHFFINGPTGTGKSMCTRSTATSLLTLRNEDLYLVVIDYGEVDYFWLEDHALLVTEVEDGRKVLELLNKEMDRRNKLLRKHRAVKVQELPDKIPFIVVLIDEFVEMAEDEESVSFVNRLLRKGRKAGIHIVAATQRLSHNSMKGAGDIKHNFPARFTFRCDAVNSRMVLGEGPQGDAASRVPNIKGRGIYCDSDKVHEIQTFYIPPKQAEKLVEELPAKRQVFHIEQPPPMLPAR